MLFSQFHKINSRYLHCNLGNIPLFRYRQHPMTLPQKIDLISLINSDFMNEEWLKATVAQLEKDMETSGWKFVFKNEVAENLVEELSIELRKASHHQLQSMLYRIDVPMKEVTNNYEKLSLAIWNRELKKVWIRKKFSEHNQ